MAAPSGKKDYYQILNVPEDASNDEIRTAYLKLALKWHPDKHRGDDAASNKFQEIGEAYHVLIDPVQRAEYDSVAEYNVDHYELEEYLRRFQAFILTSNGLGLDSALCNLHTGPCERSGFGGLLGVL
mmetsp:Transcript_2338/g.4731  ORF Transcript_2338/g.4731 Transcript_2338/m.4731 type:complete len:127 (-) Transcript_2338:460-840(-)|eukprot:CAMPEP_0118936080 /NCGR_PEP_ID=MMETSP1169-20130426/15999_1 /TAXON_ID=36882 /ORGANISM="Pyramimonas obovata, Strain CCMP722" /LENGTH=126 /DNA_ID=CAMNT_0006879187 /DNA_START=124 /DNA_END=504 /DNA_ORIENTATION=-